MGAKWQHEPGLQKINGTDISSAATEQMHEEKNGKSKGKKEGKSDQP